MSDLYSKDTFERADQETKLYMIFDIAKSTNDVLTLSLKEYLAHKKACEDRFKKLENRKWRDKGIASASGFLGGFLAMISERFLK